MYNVNNQGYYGINMAGIYYAKQQLNKQHNIILDLVKGHYLWMQWHNTYMYSSSLICCVCSHLTYFSH